MYVLREKADRRGGDQMLSRQSAVDTLLPVIFQEEPEISTYILRDLISYIKQLLTNDSI